MSDQTPILTVDGLVKEYDDSVRAVDDVSFTVDSGEIVGLLGPNGAGKTTTIKCVMGLIEPTDGTLRVGDVDPTAGSSATYELVAGTLEGARNVYWRLTVRENLRFFTGLGGVHPNTARDHHDRLLERLDLTAKADTPARELSRGMKQKLSLACTLVRETPLVFLDEPTLGLDVEAKRDLRAELPRLANEDDRAIVVSSHDMDTIREVCDRVIVLDGGRVIADDSVTALLDLFRRQVYRVTVADPSRVRGRLATEALTTTWHDSVVRVELDDPDAFHTLTGRLRDLDATVESIETVEPDLADVFLDITAGDRLGGEPA
ncbi:ABC transporter ATP-binding protein [Halobaculum sp. MBLA0143]|uniref:ABC transporter ATP-binding protein n=1 Tax=Halobaculum sp. MBLA0143 TaxID=3079933 RepID=UPI00352590E2